MKNFLIKLYVFLFIKRRKIKWPKQKTIEKEFNKNMDDFSNRINKLPYKYNPFWGFEIINDTISPEDFFNENIEDGRDCDDLARIWSIWGIIHGFKVMKWVVYDIKNFFKSVYIFTILNKDNRYYLMDFKCHGPFRSEEEIKKFILSFVQYRNCETIMIDPIVLKENK